MAHTSGATAPWPQTPSSQAVRTPRRMCPRARPPALSGRSALGELSVELEAGRGGPLGGEALRVLAAACRGSGIARQLEALEQRAGEVLDAAVEQMSDARPVDDLGHASVV